MPQGRLIDEGIHKLGINQSYRYWTCVDCGTTYPEIEGVVSCNGKAIKVCECSDGTDSPWLGSKLPRLKAEAEAETAKALTLGTLAPGL